jgi:hypothetical protein
MNQQAVFQQPAKDGDDDETGAHAGRFVAIQSSHAPDWRDDCAGRNQAVSGMSPHKGIAALRIARMRQWLQKAVIHGARPSMRWKDMVLTTTFLPKSFIEPSPTSLNLESSFFHPSGDDYARLS